MKKGFVTWYTEEMKRKTEERMPTEQIDVNFNLTRLNPIHANWMIEMYNFLTSEEGKLPFQMAGKNQGL